MKRAKSVDSYIESTDQWQDAMNLLREMLCATGMKETVKWGMPVYTVNNKNVAGFSAFKSFVGIWFYQGVFLTDPANKLINAQEGVTKALRQWRFTTIEEIRENREIIMAYLEEAIRNQIEGKEMKPDRSKPLEIPVELEKAFSANPALRDSFDALSLSKRRDYAEHISSAKRDETRQQRLEKMIPMVLDGIGLYDKYK
jgi:uncharacterized protein YdeI (YjbR/CyaY-like superfamily)